MAFLLVIGAFGYILFGGFGGFFGAIVWTVILFGMGISGVGLFAFMFAFMAEKKKNAAIVKMSNQVLAQDYRQKPKA